MGEKQEITASTTNNQNQGYELTTVKNQPSVTLLCVKWNLKQS